MHPSEAPTRRAPDRHFCWSGALSSLSQRVSEGCTKGRLIRHFAAGDPHRRTSGNTQIQGQLCMDWCMGVDVAGGAGVVDGGGPPAATGSVRLSNQMP